jgi:hypothetical protein
MTDSVPGRAILAVTFLRDTKVADVGAALGSAGWTIVVAHPSGSLEARDGEDRALVIDEPDGVQVTRMRDGTWPADEGRAWLATTGFAPLAPLFVELRAFAFAYDRAGRAVAKLQVDLPEDDLAITERIIAEHGFAPRDEYCWQLGDLVLEDQGGTIYGYLGGVPELAGALPPFAAA